MQFYTIKVLLYISTSSEKEIQEKKEPYCLLSTLGSPIYSSITGFIIIKFHGTIPYGSWFHVSLHPENIDYIITAGFVFQKVNLFKDSTIGGHWRNVHKYAFYHTSVERLRFELICS